jgi:hypothetical protein
MKIREIRAVTKTTCAPVGPGCGSSADAGPDKPPC